MFGYLRVQKSELRVREWEAYRSVYCGLCRQMGKDYSFLTRLTLSYDCTFYAILLMSLHRSCKGFDKGRCCFNPMKKCGFARCEGDAYSKAAALSVIAAFYKLQDDLSDSGFFKRLIVRLAKPFFSRWHRKAAKKYPELETPLSAMMEAQRAAEQDMRCSVDRAADPTAVMVGSVLALEAQDETEKRILYEFGYHIGRWVYLMDAADDLEDDIKNNSFNPFRQYDGQDMRAYQTVTLNSCLARAYNAYNLMEPIDFKGILDNMMLYGFPAKQNSVVHHLKEEQNGESV